MFTQHTFKVEFKYGKSIFDYPQFISIYVNNRNFSLVKCNHDYVHYWYQYFLPEYVSCAQIDTNNVPPYRDYIRTLNSTTYGTTLQKQLYYIMKNDHRTQTKLYAVVDRSIDKYLSTLKLVDIDFEAIEKMVRKQMDKIFITLFVYSTDDKFVLQFLLRWKNYKGLSGPALQVGIKKMI